MKTNIKDALNGPAVLIGGYDIPQFLLADSGFCNDGHLICPFNLQGVTFTLGDKQVNYNRRISRCRVKIENAIGYLKNRWTILKRKNHYSPAFMCDVLLACCVLHNFLL